MHTGSPDSTRTSERWQELDKLVTLKACALAAQLHLARRNGNRELGDGAAILRTIGGVEYLVRSERDPLVDGLEIDMRSDVSYRVAKGFDGRFTWGPADASAFPADWTRHEPLAVRVADAIVARLGVLCDSFWEDCRGVTDATRAKADGIMFFDR